MAEDLQNEVERILRRLTLDEIKAVATHLQIGGMENEDNVRTVLRSVEDHFDGEADANAKDLLLRGLPIPEAHLGNYQQLLNPDQVVPLALVAIIWMVELLQMVAIKMAMLTRVVAVVYRGI